MKPKSNDNSKIILNNLPVTKRERIKQLLLDGCRDNDDYTKLPIHTYEKVAFECDVSVAAVRAVASSIRQEIQARDLQMEGEVKALALSGAKMALAQLVDRLQAGEIQTKDLHIVAGILTDKYIALKNADKQAAAVAIIGDPSDLAVSIIETLQRAADRSKAIDVEPLEE